MNIAQVQSRMHLAKPQPKNKKDCFVWAFKGLNGLVEEHFDDNNDAYFIMEGYDDKMTLEQALQEIAQLNS